MDTLSILCWNIRGINNATARRNLKDLIRDNNPMFVFLQETKCQYLEPISQEYFWSSQDHSWVFSPSRGLSGGLLISWNKSYFSLEASIIKDSWIWIRGNMANSPQIFNFVNVYNPNSLGEKRIVWQDITNLLISHNEEPFCIMGDFNCILNDQESLNCKYK